MNNSAYFSEQVKFLIDEAKKLTTERIRFIHADLQARIPLSKMVVGDEAYLTLYAKGNLPILDSRYTVGMIVTNVIDKLFIRDARNTEIPPCDPEYFIEVFPLDGVMSDTEQWIKDVVDNIYMFKKPYTCLDQPIFLNAELVYHTEAVFLNYTNNPDRCIAPPVPLANVDTTHSYFKKILSGIVLIKQSGIQDIPSEPLAPPECLSFFCQPKLSPPPQ